jgi:hypothetical protein
MQLEIAYLSPNRPGKKTPCAHSEGSHLRGGRIEYKVTEDPNDSTKRIVEYSIITVWGPFIDRVYFRPAVSYSLPM